MTVAPKRRTIILWTGAKHSGKTTAAVRLVEEARRKGLVVAGIIAPAVHRSGRLIGYDVVDLAGGERTALARPGKGDVHAGRFAFLQEGLKLGTEALSARAAGNADLIIVDEYGPLEIANQGWRTAVDRLIAQSGASVLLVVRRQLAGAVAELYPQVFSETLPAGEPDSIARVIAVLQQRVVRIAWPPLRYGRRSRASSAPNAAGWSPT